MLKNVTRFNDLWKRNVEGHLTADESIELHRMIVSGDYNAEIDQFAGQAVDVDHDDITLSEDTDARMFTEVLRQRESLDNVPVYTARRRKIGSAWAIAAGVVLLAVAAFWAINRTPGIEPSPVAQNIELTGKRYLHLPDGTAVTMNEGSTLTYSPTFGDSIREVILVGEAFFDVTHDPTHPFVVRTPEGINTTVLGTAFNVRAFPDQATITVTVERGKVRVGTRAGELAVLTPAQEVTIQRKTLAAAQTAIDTDEAIAWRKSLLIMDGVSISDAAALIAQHFNVRVKIGNPEFQACRISLSFLNHESIEDVLTAIDDVTGGSHALAGDAYTITGSCHNQ